MMIITKKLMLILLGVTSVLTLSSCNDTKNNEKDNLDTNEEELSIYIVDTIYSNDDANNRCDYYIEIYNDDTSKIYLDSIVIYFDANNFDTINIYYGFDFDTPTIQTLTYHNKELTTFPGLYVSITEDVYTFTYDTFEFILSEHRNIIKVNCNGFNTCKQYNFMI